MACVLIVEDDQKMRLAYEKLLRERGHTVCFAPSALGAIDMLRIEKKAIDLVLLDIRLGKTLSGLEVARHLGEPDDPPVIVITGVDVDELRRDPLERVARILQKTQFTGEELLDEIDRQLGEK